MTGQEEDDFQLAGEFNEALVRLYAIGSPGDFSVRALEAFAILFSNTCISYNEIDHEVGVVVNSIDKPLPISREVFAEQWKKWSAEHPGVIYRRLGGTRTVLQISDLLTEREFSETAFYNEFWRLLGIRHQLTAIVPFSDRIVAVSVNRESSFTPGEVQLMTLMQPHFCQAYQIMRSLAPLCSQAGWPDLSEQ